jgi:hypothetical protein
VYVIEPTVTVSPTAGAVPSLVSTPLANVEP